MRKIAMGLAVVATLALAACKPGNPYGMTVKGVEVIAILPGAGE